MHFHYKIQTALLVKMVEQTVANTLYNINLTFARILLITFTITTEPRSMIRSSASKT